MPSREIEVPQLVIDIIDEQERRGWSNRRVALTLSISPSTLSNWYAGMAPTLNGDNLNGICAFLGISHEDVLNRLGWIRDGDDYGDAAMRPYLTSAA